MLFRSCKASAFYSTFTQAIFPIAPRIVSDCCFGKQTDDGSPQLVAIGGTW
jgi:hypothetical protein